MSKRKAQTDTQEDSSKRNATSPAAPKSAAPKSAETVSVAPPHAVDVAQPPPSLHLLSQSTGKRGSWDIAIADARIETYTYTWEGQTRTASAFRCSLVSVSDSSVYCMGELKKEAQAKTTPAQALAKYKVGTRYNLLNNTLNFQTYK